MAWPMVFDVDERWYIKPDAGRFLASPADETPIPPCDVQPEVRRRTQLAGVR